MTRRQQSSPLDDLITIASKLPWKVSILLAVTSYLILHAIASRPPLHLMAPGQMGEAISRSLVTTLAMFGQVIVPFAFVIGAIISAVNRLKQRKLYETVQTRSDISSVNEMTWQEFESLVAEHFRRNGFQVTRDGGNGSDGGIDIVLRKGREKHLVQCKQWRAYKVGVQPVREFYGVMAASGAAGGFFVTSGSFTDDALQFAHGLNLELIDGRNLKEIIGPPKTEQVPFAFRPQASSPPSLSPPAESRSCPKCGSSMRKRTVRQGPNAGKEFWGCSTYPHCNGIHQAAPVPVEPIVDAIAAVPEKRACPHCGSELVRKRFQSGPKEGQEFYGCVPCRKRWPVDRVR